MSTAPPLYLQDGITRIEDLKRMGLVPPLERLIRKRPVAVYECIQEIPCNSCVFACRPGAVIMENVNAIPRVDFDRCTGCMACQLVCPGLAIFILHIRGDKGYVTMQYEFLPMPKVGDEVIALNREGKEACRAKVSRILPPERNDGTALVTLEVPKDLVNEVRAFRVE